MEERSDRFTALEDRFAGYAVYDPAGEKIGKVDDLFVDQSDEPEYIGVKMGFLGTRSTLIPWDAVSTADDEGRTITVDIDKEKAKNGPTFDDDREITPEFEEEVYSYYGLSRSASTEESGAYEGYYDETASTTDATTTGEAATSDLRSRCALSTARAHRRCPTFTGTGGRCHTEPPAPVRTEPRCPSRLRRPSRSTPARRPSAPPSPTPARRASTDGSANS